VRENLITRFDAVESDSDEDDDNVLNPLDDASTMGLGALNASFVEMIPTTSMMTTIYGKREK